MACSVIETSMVEGNRMRKRLGTHVTCWAERMLIYFDSIMDWLILHWFIRSRISFQSIHDEDERWLFNLLYSLLWLKVPGKWYWSLSLYSIGHTLWNRVQYHDAFQTVEPGLQMRNIFWWVACHDCLHSDYTLFLYDLMNIYFRVLHCIMINLFLKRYETVLNAALFNELSSYLILPFTSGPFLWINILLREIASKHGVEWS